MTLSWSLNSTSALLGDVCVDCMVVGLLDSYSGNNLGVVTWCVVSIGNLVI